jgi:L-amino acid N-acyltransferase YncA
MTAPSSSIRIREAAEADMAAVCAIYAREVVEGTATFETEPPTLAEMMQRRAAVLAYPCPYLVAVEGAGDAVLGFAYAGPFRPRAAFRGTVENTVYVAPLAQRRGVGLMLTRAVIERCTVLGFEQMVAVIGGDNRGSISMHARAGFHHCGVLRKVGRKFDRWLDVMLMQRALAATDQK